MKFTEEYIDTIVEKMSILDEKGYTIDSSFEKFENYLVEEVFPLLNADEKDLIGFLTLCVQQLFDSNLKIDMEKYVQTEEKHWSLFESKSSTKFNSKLDIFFKTYQEEDFMAFVEDTLGHDEENPQITNVGREIIWNTILSLFVCLYEELEK